MSTLVATLWRTLRARRRFFLIAGPCVIESEALCFEVARFLKRLCARYRVPYVFKASYDKANRTSGESYRGPGLAAGLAILGRLRSELGVPVLTDVHSPEEAAMAGKVVDVLQVPAFLCRQTDLIAAAAATNRVVNLKKGQFLAPEDMRQVVRKAEAAGGRRLLLTERGASFGYHNLVADMRSIPVMRAWGYPVVFDATHAVQLPAGGGDCSGGQREHAPVLARAAVAAGADGVFIETHPDPDRALSDGPNMVPLSEMANLLRSLRGVYAAVRGVVALAVLMVGIVAGQAQIPEAPIRGFAFPILDRQTLQLRARVRGDLAQAAGAGRVTVQGARLESFGKEGETNLLVLTEHCVLLTEERRLESSEALQVTSGDGRLELSGRGFSWDEVNGLTISNRVTSRLLRQSVSDVSERERTEPTGAPPEPLAIESERLTYREGLITFADNVRVREASDRLACDRLLFQLHVDPGEIAPAQSEEDVSQRVEFVEAVGGVEVTTSNVVARADRGRYDLGAQQLLLTGRPRWESAGREGEAGQVRLDQREKRLRAWDGVTMRFSAGALGAMPALDRIGGDRAPIGTDPVEIRAGSLEVWPDAESAGMNRAVFQNRVRLSRASGVMESERLDVRYSSEAPEASGARRLSTAPGGGWQLVEAVARDGVKFVQTTNVLSGVQADYSAESGVMEVTGPVAWELSGSTGRSDRLRLRVAEGTAEALGSVRMTFPGEGFAVLNLGVPVGSTDEATKEGEETAAVDVACERFVFREPGPGRPYRTADFLGGVEVVEGERTRMDCERLLTELEPATNALHRLVAAGRVVVESRDLRGRRLARGDRAEYVATEDRLWLTGEQGVEMDFIDADGTHRGRGGLAVYEVGRGVLELRNEAVLDSIHGRLAGDRIRVDREERVLAAGGRWRMIIPLHPEVQETLKTMEEGGTR